MSITHTVALQAPAWLQLLWNQPLLLLPQKPTSGHSINIPTFTFHTSRAPNLRQVDTAAGPLSSNQEATIYNLSEYRSILLNIQTSLRHVQYGKFYWV